MDINCALCNLEFKNGIHLLLFILFNSKIYFLKICIFKDKQYEQHINGKKHKLIEAIKKNRDEVAKCSLFVSGFGKDIDIDAIKTYFSQYGAIKKIVMDHENVTIKTIYSITLNQRFIFLNLRMHLLLLNMNKNLVLSMHYC
jgi:hypothetical protein